MCWNKFWFPCRSDDFAWIHSGGNKKGRKNGLQGFLWFVIPFSNAIGFGFLFIFIFVLLCVCACVRVCVCAECHVCYIIKIGNFYHFQLFA